MIDYNDLSLIKAYNKSELNQNDFKTALDFVSKSLEKSHRCFDIDVIKKYKNHPQFVENCILQFILSITNCKRKIEYVPLNYKSFQFHAMTDYIIEDEVFTSAIGSFIYSIFAIAAKPNNPEVFENSFKEIIVSLDLQGRRLELGTYNKEKQLKNLEMTDNILHIASDTYYSIWAFQIAHELYHIYIDEPNSLEQEKGADKFGYSILIELIKKQKEGQLPDDCSCFYEYTYLTPIILFEFFKLIDYWKQLCGDKTFSDDIHPSNDQRIDAVFSLFDEIVPNDFDTTEGNIILSNCLDAIDTVKNNISIKAANGKLDSIIKSPHSLT